MKKLTITIGLTLFLFSCASSVTERKIAKTVNEENKKEESDLSTFSNPFSKRTVFSNTPGR